MGPNRGRAGFGPKKTPRGMFMKRISLALIALLAAGVLAGCSGEEPKATATDKQNIDRLAKEGIGARPVDGSQGQPAKTAEDAQPAPP